MQWIGSNSEVSRNRPPAAIHNPRSNPRRADSDCHRARPPTVKQHPILSASIGQFLKYEAGRDILADGQKDEFAFPIDSHSGA